MQAGLRERKKAKTRAAIQRHALRLFQEQGYAATTVDQIAAAAEVSQSTFFRYFPTKEDVVLLDDYDPRMLQALQEQPPDVPPVRAIRGAIRRVFEAIDAADWEREQQRQRLIQTVPELQARAMQQYVKTIELLAVALTEREGLPIDDFNARVLAGAVIGASIGATMHAVGGEYELSDMDLVDQALGLLEDGLPLGGS
ncbi:TetR family transcriptional regulator [Phytohabitans rumicis]|uniref:TetR family transcriptional regulator n=2 Tax=Phytohabitans rumicis TaxID=1076125 RepID=A0A6V8LNB2_9ACTN|nr:TetR family transcriptional regulator [Phytohabitans rumicis]